MSSRFVVPAGCLLACLFAWAPSSQAQAQPSPEAQAPEAQAPEAQAPEAQAPEAQAPEAQAPEAQAPEARTPPPVEPVEPVESEMWTVQVDLLTTVLGIAHVLLERRLHDQLSVYAGPSLRLFDSPLTKDSEEGYRAYGVEVGVRWFFVGGAPSSWWFGLRGVLARMSFEGEAEPGGYVSALLGGTWTIAHRWVLSGALGLSYFAYDVGGVGVRGFRPGAHTAVGVAF